MSLLDNINREIEALKGLIKSPAIFIDYDVKILQRELKELERARRWIEKAEVSFREAKIRKTYKYEG